MAAITSQPMIQTLFNQIAIDYPHIRFVESDDFIWSADEQAIRYRTPVDTTDIWSLLHELAHAELAHQSYELDIDLISRETDAWQYAQDNLALKYGLKIDADFIDDSLDTYRLWLHQRSKCPSCQQNGLQATQNTYRCINCRCLWRVNEARRCRLQRIKLRDQGRSS